MTRPLFVIIAGPNGAGKTTCAPALLASSMPLLNADEIARVLVPTAVHNVDMQAERLLIRQMDCLLEQRADFVVESTLASRSLAARMERARAAGYRTLLLFLWLPSPEVAVQRVAERVSAGGHNVPPEVVRRRYRRGLANFFRLYAPVADGWFFFDNSTRTGPRPVASRPIGGTVEVSDSAVWAIINAEATE